MEASTPVTVKDKSRTGRKSLLDLTNSSPIFNISNDELERCHRRNDAPILKRVSSISSPRAAYNEKEIVDHVQVCLKMHAENKINLKNAWNLKIIDFMRSALQSQAFSKDTLQIGSSSLDVSAKIYGIRVDDIHSDGLKLASTLSRSNVQKNAENVEDGDSEEGNEQGNEGKQKKKKKKRIALNTVAKDPKSLLGDVPKLESVFFQSHTIHDVAGTDPLLTNKLPLDHDGYKFMLLTPQVAWASSDKINPIIENQKTCPFKLSEIQLQVCNQLPHFVIDEWNPDEENHALISGSAVQDELFYDAEGIPIPELDGSVHDLFANADAGNAYSSSDEEGGECLAQEAILNMQKIERIVNFNPSANQNLHLNEYSYVCGINLKGNKRITQIWAGPSHWKLKYIKRIISRFSGQPDKQVGAKSVRKSRTQPMPLDFYADEIPCITKKIHKTKRCQIILDSIKCTFPQLLHVSNDKDCLMSKPVYTKAYSTFPLDAEPSEVNPYNYENPNDSQYCSQGVGGDDYCDNEHNDDADNSEDENGAAARGNFEGDNLIDAPELVPKTYIQYALQAKRMNMKKLKKATWECLIHKPPNEVMPEEDMYRQKVQPTTFATIYKQLPGHISKQMTEELSCPLAFVAMLHLANEQNLQLTSQDDLKDFKIEQVTNDIM